MSECILVGNGTSLLDVENGALIDAHKTVCRFNDARLAGFEASVGTKTHVWFTVLKYPNTVLARLSPLERIYAHSWQPDPKKCQTHQSYVGSEPRAEKVSHDLIAEIAAYLKNDEYQTWSTGALAAWLMLKEFKAITITGFDWWSRDAHHYADKAKRGNLHKPAFEAKFFKKLEKDGRLNFLGECSAKHLKRDNWPCRKCGAVDHDDAGGKCIEP